MKRRKLALMMAIVMTFVSTVPALAADYGSAVKKASGKAIQSTRFIPGYSEEARQIAEQSRAMRGEIAAPVKEEAGAAKKSGAVQTQGREYKEGSVIVCVAKDGSGEAVTGGGDEIDALLAGGESLMEISEETLNDSEDFVTGGYGGEGAELRCISSDRFDTAELIDRLNEKDSVLFAQPDYIYHIDSQELSEEVPDIAEVSAVLDVSAAMDEVAEEGAASETPASGKDGAEKPYPDMTAYQYDKLSGNGVDVPDWNNPANINSKDVVVAVVDSGVDYNHPDLKDVMWKDGLKYPELTEMGGGEYGFNNAHSNSKVYDAKDPMDDYGHGTHCAGIIAASWNGQGTSGVANGAKIMAIKILGEDGSCYSSDEIKAFEYIKAAKKAGVNVRVCSNSWGGGLGETVHLANSELGNLGVVTVFAAGNESTDLDFINMFNTYSKNCDTHICVDSTGMFGEPSDYTCYGKRTTDVFSPGSYILSTVTTGMPTALPGISESVWHADFETASTQAVFKPQSDKLSFEVCRAERRGAPSDNHALKISGINGAGKVRKAVLSLGNALEEKKPKYLTFFARTTGDDYNSNRDYAKVSIGVTIPCKDAPEVRFTGSGPMAWRVTCLELPENTDYSDLKLTFDLSGSSEDFDTMELLIDDIWFTDETLPYDFYMGTSMATPNVSGVAAVLAAAFPGGSDEHENAALLRARILASSIVEDRYEELCRMQGRVSLRRALDISTYRPVVNEASVSGKELTVKGFFFGNAPEIYINGMKLAVKSGTDRMLTAALDDSFSNGEYEVRVVNEKGEGRSFFILSKEGKDPGLYDRIPLPGDYSFFYPLAGLGGKMFFCCQDREDKCHIFSYDASADKPWEEIEIKNADNMVYPLDGNAAVLNDDIVYFYGRYLCFLDVIDGEFLGMIEFEDLPMSDSIKLVNSNGMLWMMSSGVTTETGQDLMMGKSELCNVYMTSDYEVFIEPYTIFNKSHRGGALTADAEGNLYALLGAGGDTVEKVTWPTKENGLTAPKVTMMNYDLFEDDVAFDKSDENALSALSTKDGILLFQPATVSGNGMVTADNYIVSYKDGKAKKADKMLSYSPVYNVVSAAYKGKVYVTGRSYDEPGIDFLSVMDAETFENGEGNWAYTGMLSQRDTKAQIEVGGESFEISYSAYVNYTGKKHIKEGLKGTSADLRFTVSGQGTDKFYVKSIKTKNGKTSTLSPRGEAIEGSVKVPQMVPVLALVKGGEKPTSADKARLKALNAYFKAHPLRFDVLQRSFDCSRCDLYASDGKNGGIKNLVYVDMDRLIEIKVNPKEYKCEPVGDDAVLVTALPGGNFDGSVTLYSAPDNTDTDVES